MVFSSLLFLFFFLPIFLLIYFTVPKAFRNCILFLGSLIFYAYGEPIYVLIMLFSTVLDYSCGRMIDTYRNHKWLPKLGVLTSIVINLSMLGFFKYANFFIESSNHLLNMNLPLLEVLLPIGISFYTFQTMSYTIDLYRGRIDVQKNLISFGAYVSMFPQLIAGPIVTYHTVEEKLNNRNVTLDSFGEGALRFIEGLGKKVLLANNIGLLWDTISNMPAARLTVTGAWLGAAAFGLQLYFDFSGYSDMAIGLGKMLGFDFPENFNYPYISRSVTEFWRRWHITLGSWFREYVYIPLGGNRVSKPRFFFNILVVWFLTGFWHGAGWNFILWGLLFGILMILEKTFLLKWSQKIPAFFSHVYLIVIILISWVFFSHDAITEAWTYLKVMFGLGRSAFIDQTTLYALSNYSVILVIGILFALPFMKKLNSRLPEWVRYVFYMLVLVLSTAYLVDATFNPFLYFRF